MMIALMIMKNFILIAFLIFSSASFGSNLSCVKQYDTRLIQINGAIDSKNKQLILDSINKVQQIHQNEEPIKNIKFEIVSDNEFAGGQAHLSESLISIQKHAFKLPPEQFQALVEHEINHLYVVRNFISPNKNISLVEYLQRYKDDPEKTFMATESHSIFAELLCDLVPVLNHRNPKIFKNLQEQLTTVLPPDVSQKLNQSLKANMPIELSLRDFSINPEDPRWKTFNPKSGVTYHRLNQIRSFLWTKWISTLPKGKNALFYQTVEKTFNEIQQQVSFEFLLLHTDLYSLNQELINHLDSKITEAMKEH